MAEKEVGDMTIWQNHENRITTIEVSLSNLSGEFKDVKADIKDVKDMVGNGNDDQKKRLEAIDKTLMEEFFKKRRVTHETKSKIWLKATGGLLGGGGIAYALYDIAKKIIVGG